MTTHRHETTFSQDMRIHRVSGFMPSFEKRRTPVGCKDCSSVFGDCRRGLWEKGRVGGE